MRSLAFVALLFLGLLGGGCKKASKLVGKWSAPASGGTATAEFRPDGTFTMGLGLGYGTTTWGGDYTFDGTTLTTTSKSIDVPGADADTLRKAKNSLPKSAQRSKVAFASDDEITMTGVLGARPDSNDRAITMRRVE